MSLRTRLILLSIIWITVILALFNISIYMYILGKTTSHEVQMLWNRAQIILRNPTVHQPEEWDDPVLFDEFRAPDILIRIIRPDGGVAAQLASSDELVAHQVVYRTEYHTSIENGIGERLLFIQVPIYNNEAQVGLLELGHELNITAAIMELLGTGLTMTTVGVLCFAVVSGIWYTKVLIRPIRQLLETMREIRSKGDLIQLSPAFTSEKDELGQLGLTFNEMIDALRVQAARQKQFVADASHELRTPLTVIESYASLLQRWGGSDAAIREEALAAIRSETARLKSLVASMLSLASEEHTTQAIRETVRLGPLIRATADEMSTAFGRVVDVHVTDGLTCEGDSAKLKQLLIILLDNALKYSSGPVRVRGWRETDAIRISVADEGVGIPQDALAQVFERFYRVDPARSRESGGSGLGLSIARRIAELHGGRIELSSREGEGTTATISLPHPGRVADGSGIVGRMEME